MSKLKLYVMPNSCALAPHIALEWIGEAYELGLLKHGETHSPEFLQVNPKGKVPALIIEDGRLLTEAAAILIYLTSRYLEPTGIKSDLYKRYQLQEWLAYMTSEVHADFAPHFAPQRFINDESHYDAVRQATYKRLQAHYENLNQRLEGKQNPVEGGRTVADTYLYVLTRWIDQTPMSIDDYPNLKRFREEMAADDGVKQALTMQGIE